MLNPIRMPTEDELAELTYSELNDCIQASLYQWQEAKRMNVAIAVTEQIFHAYDNEQLKRLERFEKHII
jgi:hypothetical protein